MLDVASVTPAGQAFGAQVRVRLAGGSERVLPPLTVRVVEPRPRPDADPVAGTEPAPTPPEDGRVPRERKPK